MFVFGLMTVKFLYFCTMFYSLKIRINPVNQILRNNEKVKDAPSGLRQFLATESPLKMMRNVFYFISKAIFVLKIFKFLS